MLDITNMVMGVEKEVKESTVPRKMNDSELDAKEEAIKERDRKEKEAWDKM